MSNISLEDVEDMTQEELDSLTLEDYDRLEALREEKNHIKHEAKQTSAQDLRTQVMAHSLSMVEKLQQIIIQDNVEINANQKEAYDMLWPIITNIVSKTEDLRIIEANNAKEVLIAVSKGKMTFDEGMKMMHLLKEQVIIDEVPKLAEMLDNE